MSRPTISMAIATRITAAIFVIGGGLCCIPLHAESLSFSQQSVPGMPTRSGGWTLRKAAIENRTTEPALVRFLTQAGEASLQQFGRQIQALPRARRTVLYPVRIPAGIDAEQQQIALHTQFIQRLDSGDRVLPGASGQALRSSMAILEHESPVTVIIADEDDLETRPLVEACRRLQGLSTRIYELDRKDTLPVSAQMLTTIDQIVIAADWLLDDPEGLIAIRQWIQAGGRAWVLLDRVGEDLLDGLLGDAYAATVLDRISVAQFQLRDVRPLGIKRDGPLEVRDRPVAMVLTDSGSAPVAFEVAGFPAIFSYEAGQGTVMVTTLGPRGWRRDTETASDLRDARKGPLGALAQRFFGLPSPVPPATQPLRDAAMESVGYRVPPRWLAASLLAVLCVGIGVIGGLLGRRGLMSRIAWVAPAAAMLIAGVFGGIGHRSRTQLPETCATMQMVQVHPATGDYTIRGALTVFHPAASREPIEGRGEPLALEIAGGDGTARPTVWTDLDRWQIEAAMLPAGLSQGAYTVHKTSTSQIGADASPTPDGLAGMLRLPASPTSAAGIVVSPGGPAMAADINQDGSFLGLTRDVLADDTFTSTHLVSDQDRRRIDLLREFVAWRRAAATPSGPMLLCWTKAWDTHLSLTAESDPRGEALVAVPLRLRRPASAARISLPPPLLPYDVVGGPDGTTISSAYSNETRRWIDELSRQTKISLRLQIPDALLPAKVDEVRLHATVHAPGRSVTVAGWRGKRRVQVAEWSSPIRQQIVCRIDNTDLLELDPQGGLILNLDIGPHPDEPAAAQSKTAWRLSNVYLTATAILLGETG